MKWRTIGYSNSSNSGHAKFNQGIGGGRIIHEHPPISERSSPRVVRATEHKIFQRTLALNSTEKTTVAGRRVDDKNKKKEKISQSHSME